VPLKLMDLCGVPMSGPEPSLARNDPKRKRPYKPRPRRTKPNQPKQGRGAPPKYTPEIADAICSAIAAGDTVKQAAEGQGIGERTFWGWMRERPELTQAYTRARDIRNQFTWGEQIIDIADDAREDRDDQGRLNKEHVLRSKLRIEGRQWHLERAASRYWAPKSSVATTVAMAVDQMGEEQREALIEGMLKRLEVIARPAMRERERQRQLEASKLIDVTPEAKTEGGIGSKPVPDASES
jgi:terminase small subunit-like protein